MVIPKQINGANGYSLSLPKFLNALTNNKTIQALTAAMAIDNILFCQPSNNPATANNLTSPPPIASFLKKYIAQ